MLHGPKTNPHARRAFRRGEAFPLAADLTSKNTHQGMSGDYASKLASGVFGRKMLPCFSATAQLSGEPRKGCGNEREKSVRFSSYH